MHRLSTTFVLGYHGCSQETAESVLKGVKFNKSENGYDWLGDGIYFWENDPWRAYEYYNEKKKREKLDTEATVVGAVIDLGYCLDMSTREAVKFIQQAYEIVAFSHAIVGDVAIPENTKYKKNLDCAVINTAHEIVKNRGLTPFNTVKSPFLEGNPIYDSATFLEKTHTQICVCTPDESIKGVFRVSPKLYK